MESSEKAKRKEVEEKEEKEKEETCEAQKKKLVEKVQLKDRTVLHGEGERGEGRKRRPKGKQTSQRKTSPAEVWKMALPPFAMSIPGNERRLAQVWVNVRGEARMFTAYIWHTEGWSPRHEAILEAVLK